MSLRRGSADESESVVETIREWYQIPTLVLLLSFMLWVRLRGYPNFVRDGRVLFSGNDAWYHLRQVTYTVQNWPATMPFDPWTNFSYGTSSSQFGTLFDQLIATAALVVGLGSPSDQLVATVVLVAPAVFGTVVGIPAYLAGRRLGGPLGGVVSVLILALSTGGFLRRSLVGFSDHHIAEALFMMTAVLVTMIAVTVAQEERPVWELIENREFHALRRPVGWAALSGVAIALYLWVWPPGVLLLGILGVFYLFQLSFDVLRGHSPDHIAVVGVVSLVVTGVLTLVPLNSFEISATNFSLLQPLMAVGVAAGCGFMAWLARQFERQEIDRRAYPVTVFGLIGIVVLLMNLLAPELYGFFANNVQRVVGLGTSARGGTVGEVQPLSRPVATFISNFGLTFVIAAFSVLVIGYHQVRREMPRAETLLVAIWAIILLLATLTQNRFEYYLVLPIAVLNAYLIALISQYITPSPDADGIETFQILSIVTVLMLVVAPMVIATGPAAAPAWQQGERNAPSPGVVGWDSSLEWLETNSPVPGTAGGADNEMALYGTVDRQDDFDYPEGSYGVISWWDYGHWITQRGERIPNANPFQQGAAEAANFLLAPNESQANSVLSRMDEDDATTRYVMVDWKMVDTFTRIDRGRFGGKFFAPIVFYEDSDVSQRDFFTRVFTRRQGTRLTGYHVRTQRYYESMVNRLWHFHGSARNPSPIVVDFDRQTTSRGTLRTPPRSGNSSFRRFQNLQEARQFVEEDGSAQVGGIGPNPPGRVSALEGYRLVRNANRSAFSGRQYARSIQRETLGLLGRQQGTPQQQRRQQAQIQGALLPRDSRNGSQLVSPPWVKIFERVPGATIQGEGPANVTVAASVEMYSPATDRHFRYRQQTTTGPNGSFELTVPYSTTGYDNWGPSDGYTNVSTRATGDYRLVTGPRIVNGSFVRYEANATVTEAQVIGEDPDPTTVTLEETELQDLTQGNSSGDGLTITQGDNESTQDANDSTQDTSESTEATTETNSTQSIAAPRVDP